MSFPQTPFQIISPEDKIPMKVNSKLPTKNSIIRGSTVEKAVPSSPATLDWAYGTPSSTTFNINSKGFFMDPDAASLMFEVEVGTGGTIPAFDNTNYTKLAVLESVVSLIASCQLKVGGIVTDDIQMVAPSIDQELVLSASTSWYNTVGFNQLKMWKNAALACNTVAGLGDGTSIAAASGMYKKYVEAIKMYYDVSVPTIVIRKKVHCEIPLQLLFGLFRMESYIPLAFLNSMEMTINWNNKDNCIFCPDKTINNFVIKVDKLRVIYRTIELEPEVLKVFKYLVEEDSTGLAYAYDTKAVQLSTVPVNQGRVDFTATRSSPYVKNVYITRKPGDCINKSYVLSSAAPRDGLEGYQVNIQNYHYPNYGYAEGMAMMADAIECGHGSSACNALMSYPFGYTEYFDVNNFYTPTNAGFNVVDAMKISNGTCVLGVSFEKDINSEYDYDGLDTSSLGATFSISLQEGSAQTGNTADNATTRSVLVSFKYARVLTLKNGVLQIAG